MLNNQYLLYLLAKDLSLALPLPFAYRLAKVIANIYYLFYKKERMALIENLLFIKREKMREIKKSARKVFENFAKNLVDFFRFGLMDRRFFREKVKIVGLENLDMALKLGKGVLGLTAHIGNWELGGIVMTQKGYPINAVIWEHKDKRINRLFIHQRERKGIKVIPLGVALRRCFKALRNGEIVAMLGDRDFSPQGNRTKVNFLGKKFLVPRGPATLSLRTGAVIVPGFTIREKDDSFTLYFEKPIQCFPSGEHERDISRLTQEIVDVIERYVKKFPEQWFMFREFWEQQRT